MSTAFCALARFARLAASGVHKSFANPCILRTAVLPACSPHPGNDDPSRNFVAVRIQGFFNGLLDPLHLQAKHAFQEIRGDHVAEKKLPGFAEPV